MFGSAKIPNGRYESKVEIAPKPKFLSREECNTNYKLSGFEKKKSYFGKEVSE